VVKLWNNLPEEVVMAPTVNCFKGRFDRVPTTDTVWNENTDQLKMPNETTIQTLLQLDNTRRWSTGILPIQDRQMMMAMMKMG